MINKKRERLQLKIGYIVDGKKYRTEAEQKRARVEALHKWLDHDGRTGPDSFKGVHIIGNWRNPDNWNPAHANWKTTDDGGQSLKEFYETMHGKRGALYAIYQQNLKDFAALGPSKDDEPKRKKPKARRRIISKLVKRKDGKKFVRGRRVAKRKAPKSVRGKPKPSKSPRKTRKPGAN